MLDRECGSGACMTSMIHSLVPHKFTEPGNLLRAWFQSQTRVQLVAFDNRVVSKPSPAQTDRGIEPFVTRTEQGNG